MKIDETRFSVMLVLIVVLFALSASAFLYGILRGLASRYQESILLIGVAFIVLAFAVITYRFYKYPDEGIERAREK
ncbi:MAG: hypothetical protein ACE5QF_01860 [Thermoplasmata archaeon]